MSQRKSESLIVPADAYQPLAARIRPQKLEEYIGQSHLVGDGKPLRIAVAKHEVFSMIFWGSPGVGKTSLAKILANAVNATFVELSAVSAGKADIKIVIENAGLSKNERCYFWMRFIGLIKHNRIFYCRMLSRVVSH